MKRIWTVMAASVLLIATSAATAADPLPINQLPINQLPMYGGRAKTEEMKSADAVFIASMEKQGLSRAEGAKQMLRKGWTAWGKRDMTTAMARFNQAWLLDPENGNVYHGFALVLAVRDGESSDVEDLFLLATSKPTVDEEAFVDYGQFLWMEERLDESQAQLKKALQISKTARNARANMAFVHYLKNDMKSACTWAAAAEANGDTLQKEFPDQACFTAGR